MYFTWNWKTALNFSDDTFGSSSNIQMIPLGKLKSNLYSAERAEISREEQSRSRNVLDATRHVRSK
jgi:hypothetical protein